jgi:hypothetical protein
MSRSLLILLLAALVGCEPQAKNPDGSPAEAFYTEVSIGDGVRLPLLKPYEVLRLSGSPDWIMNGHDDLPGAAYVDKVAVLNDVLLLHSRAKIDVVEADTAFYPEAWYIISPTKKQQHTFATRQEFGAFLAAQHLDPARVRLYPIDSVFASFQKKYPIDWQRDFQHLSGTW